VRAIAYLVSRRFEDAYQVAAAWGWNLVHLFGTGRRRARAQAVRRVPDRQVRQFMASIWIRFDQWSRRALEAVRPAAVMEAAGVTEAGAEAERPSLWARSRALALAHPVAVAWVLAAVLLGVSYRHLLTASPLSGGALATFPSSPRAFFDEFLSGLRHTALGGTSPATPALPVLGVSSAIAFANPSLAQKILLLVLPVMASIGCYRALRRIPIGRMGGVLGAACYGLSPLMLWALSDGRLPELVFMSGLPWLTGRLIAFFGSNPPTRRVRWIVGAALGLGALAAFFPGTFLAAGIVVVVALILPGGGGRVTGLARAGLAGGGAILLAWPAVVGVLGSAGRGLGDGVGTPSFADALRVALAPAPGDWVIAFFLPLSAAFGIAFAAGAVRRPAARSMLLALAGIYLAWTAGNGWLPAWLSNPVAYGALAAFGMASLVAMGMESVLSGLHRRSFGVAQFGSAFLVGIVAVGLVGQSFQAMRGSWQIGGGSRTSPAYAVVQPQDGGSYRVLWIGRRLGGSFPAPGGVPTGSAAAGAASVRFAVTAPAGASAFDFGRSFGGSGYDGLSQVMSAILAGPTRQGGAMLAQFDIRYVVAGNDDLPPLAQVRLGEQLDLVASRAAGLTIFRDTVSVAPASAIADPSWRRAASTGDPTAAAPLRQPDATSLGGSDGAYTGGPFPGRTFPPGASVLLTQQFDARWRLEPVGRGPAIAPRPAFGWAVGFAYRPTTAGFTVRFTGQTARTVEVVFLSILWLAALWITRRPSRAG
jgi:hypothetical protein